MSAKFASTFVDDDCHIIVPVFPLNVIGIAFEFKHNCCVVGVIVPATDAGFTVTKTGFESSDKQAPLFTVAL
jgi:hypothetical protein